MNPLSETKILDLYPEERRRGFPTFSSWILPLWLFIVGLLKTRFPYRVVNHRLYGDKCFLTEYIARSLVNIHVIHLFPILFSFFVQFLIASVYSRKTLINAVVSRQIYMSGTQTVVLEATREKTFPVKITVITFTIMIHRLYSS